MPIKLHTESVGVEGHFQFKSESIFNDQENTDLTPDYDDPDFVRHVARTPVRSFGASSMNAVFSIRCLPTYRPHDALNLDDSAGSSSSILDLDIEKIAASTPMVPVSYTHLTLPTKA